MASEQRQRVVSTPLGAPRCGKAQAGLILASFRKWHELGLEGRGVHPGKQHYRQKEQHVKNQQPVRGHRSVCEKESALVRFMAGAQRAEQALVQLLRDYGGLKQAKRVGLKSPGLTIQTAGESQ